MFTKRQDGDDENDDEDLLILTYPSGWVLKLQKGENSQETPSPFPQLYFIDKINSSYITCLLIKCPTHTYIYASILVQLQFSVIHVFVGLYQLSSLSDCLTAMGLLLADYVTLGSKSRELENSIASNSLDPTTTLLLSKCELLNTLNSSGLNNQVTHLFLLIGWTFQSAL